MLIDLVLEGGGAKGVALSGAVEGILERGFRPRRLVGTSAGAITATNLAIGYTPQEILTGSLEKTGSGASIYTTFSDAPPSLTDEELLNTEIGQVLAAVPLPFVHDRAALMVLRALDAVPGLRSLLALSEVGGLHAGDAFLAWMHKMLRDRGLPENMTFSELHAHNGAHLSHVATDTTAQQMCVFNHHTTPDLPIAWGVRMSMSIPFFWKEVTWRADWGTYLGAAMDGHRFVDGGVVSNFPLHLFSAPEDPSVRRWMGAPPAESARVLGLYLDAEASIPDWPVEKAASRGLHSPLLAHIDAVLDTMMAASDNSAVATSPELVCRLPVQGVGATQFDLADQGYQALYAGGRAAAHAYFDRESR